MWNQPSTMASAVAVGVVVVAGEDADALEQDLAVVGDPDAGARQRRPDRADPDLVRGVHRHGSRGLGEAVALEDDDADAAVEVTEAGAEWRTAGHGVAHLTAHGGAQLAVDETVEDGVLDPEPQTGAARVERLAVGDRDGGGAEEDLPLALGGRLGLGRVEDLLEDARDGEHEGRLESGEVVEEGLDVRRVAHACPARDAEHLDEAREDVGQREEEQCRRVVGQYHLAQLLDGVLGEVEEVAVGQLAPLGPPRRARGVDDRCHRPPVEAGAACGQVGVRDLPALLAQGVEAAAVDGDDIAERWQLAPDLVDGGTVSIGLDDDDLRVGVRQDPLHLLGGRGLVDRHDDGARTPGSEVDECPLVARARHECQPVPGRQTRGHEPPGHGGDVVGELRPRHVRPAAGGGLAGERGLVRVLRGIAHGQVRKASLRRDGGKWCDDVVLHCHSWLRVVTVLHLTER